ncbi:unnamed protein product [Periconia digitata]|uniref:Secreted protein n=1 Tax=Periconia digitata TaxID=1303443 RepID=A0A9W4XNG0_9PLEO|nr:unnamed protein product [Periconia digitata]
MMKLNLLFFLCSSPPFFFVCAIREQLQQKPSSLHTHTLPLSPFSLRSGEFLNRFLHSLLPSIFVTPNPH